LKRILHLLFSCDQVLDFYNFAFFLSCSHDDVGWLKTVDEYFTGAHPEIQNACVKCTLDNVVAKLKENPDRKFVEVEMAFFWKWWNQASDDQKNLVKGYLKNGQLEFIGGGWSMNDEAAV
jgi:hypothetical protein